MNTRNYQRLADSPLFLFLIYSLISFFIHVFVIQSFVETSFSQVVVYICHYLRARRRNSIKSYMCKPRPCHLFRAIRKSHRKQFKYNLLVCMKIALKAVVQSIRAPVVERRENLMLNCATMEN